MKSLCEVFFLCFQSKLNGIGVARPPDGFRIQEGGRDIAQADKEEDRHVPEIASHAEEQRHQRDKEHREQDGAALHTAVRKIEQRHAEDGNGDQRRKALLKEFLQRVLLDHRVCKEEEAKLRERKGEINERAQGVSRKEPERGRQCRQCRQRTADQIVCDDGNVLPRRQPGSKLFDHASILTVFAGLFEPCKKS